MTEKEKICCDSVEIHEDLLQIVNETMPEETFDPEKAHNAQAAYCREKMYPHFAPSNGKCWKCRQNIYLPVKNRNGYQSLGISVERAGRELITGCPHCNWSFCE